MRLALIVASAAALAAIWGESTAVAQHEHHHHAEGADDAGAAPAEPDDDTVTGRIGVVGASYDTMLYTGDYQGVDASARWNHGRWTIGLRVPAFRLQRNGEVIYGLGDVGVDGSVTLFTRADLALGVMLGVTAPTGDDRKGLGMGHVMLMGMGWLGWRRDRLELAASAGYGRALGGAAAHAEHGGGAWPLVDPMSSSELMFSASADLGVASTLKLGASATAAVPVPRDDGDDRATAGVHVIIATGRFTTTAAIDAGLAGDPYEYRGTLSTEFRFR